MGQTAFLNNLRVSGLLTGLHSPSDVPRGDDGEFALALAEAGAQAAGSALVAGSDSPTAQHSPDGPVRLGKSARPPNLRDEVQGASDIDLAQMSADELQTADAPQVAPPPAGALSKPDAKPTPPRERGAARASSATSEGPRQPGTQGPVAPTAAGPAPEGTARAAGGQAQPKATPPPGGAAAKAAPNAGQQPTQQTPLAPVPVAATANRVIQGASPASGSRVDGIGGVGRASGPSAKALLDRLASQAPERPRPREEPPAVAQVARGLAAVLKQGGGTAVLRLQPEHLGQLRVEVTIEAEQVSARIETSNDSARELLLDSKDSLRSALEARGLSVERIEVETVRRHDDASGDSQAQDHSGQRANQDATGGDRQGARDDLARPPHDSAFLAGDEFLVCPAPGAISYGPDAQEVYRLRLDAVA